MSVHNQPSVRLNPDFSVAQVDLDRRTVVMLYEPSTEEHGNSSFEGPLPWIHQA